MVLEWGMFVVGYLFLGGLAGGAFMVSSTSDLLGKGKFKVLSKSGAYVSFISILIGLILLVVDLGRFRVDPLTALNSYVNFPTSIVSVGTWIITAFMVVTALTSILWFFNGSDILRRLVELVGLVLGGSTAAYTGLLLAFTAGSPFWNTPYLPWLFMVSGTLTGLAMTLLLIPIIAKLIPRFSEDFKILFTDNKEFLSTISSGQKYIVALIIMELILVAIEVGAGNAYAEFQYAGQTTLFLTYLIVGLIVPLGIGYYTWASKRTENEMPTIMLSLSGFVLLLVGGFILRYIILITGQLIS